MNINDVTVRLVGVSAFAGGTLSELLEKFTPDYRMTQELKPYLDNGWGDKSVIDFLDKVINTNNINRPKIEKGKMTPFNILLVLHEMTRNV